MFEVLIRGAIYFVLLAVAVFQTTAIELDNKVALNATAEIIAPASYDKNIHKKYPVVYLFDSTPFYVGNYFTEAKLAMEQLAAQHNFPEVIIVNIKIESVYASVNTRRNDLLAWFKAELQPQINGTYRTLNKQVAVGFSYTGGWVAADLGSRATDLTDVLSLSPVFEHASYVAKTDGFSASSPTLRIYFGDEHRRLATEFVSIWAEKKRSEKLLITELSAETHQSSFIPSLRHGLLAVFSDYRSLAYPAMSESNWTAADVAQFFIKRERLYSLSATDEEKSDLHTAFAKAYTYSGKLELASEHWLKSASKHKGYFISQIADELELAGNAGLAMKIREHFKQIL